MRDWICSFVIKLRKFSTQQHMSYAKYVYLCQTKELKFIPLFQFEIKLKFEMNEFEFSYLALPLVLMKGKKERVTVSWWQNFNFSLHIQNSKLMLSVLYLSDTSWKASANMQSSEIFITSDERVYEPSSSVFGGWMHDRWHEEWEWIVNSSEFSFQFSPTYVWQLWWNKMKVSLIKMFGLKISQNRQHQTQIKIVKCFKAQIKEEN